ncbi:Phosphoglycolate phosphatase [Paenibacillus nuruki]|uniref:Phosphoglycolate phosphatase n=1 Tax=Paenibacillus nuruki TaxID=1886670 RepID=A0A1E3KXC4_9BACL|nr:HAD family hydrolase [Paenibacillus nuruki]ODP26043.1 Phosphoglycolate phosphatase [Paenibacillus nuruki]
MIEKKINFSDNQLFIFDLDGTIVDSKQLMTEALGECYQNLGIEDPPYNHFFSLMGKSLEAIFRELNIPIELVRNYQHYCSSHKDRIYLFPYMAQIIKSLSDQKKKMAILTGKDRIRTFEILKMYNIMNYFEEVVTSDDITYSKPDPEGIEKILKKLNGNISSTIMIGDGLFDIQCAKNANISSAFVCWGTGEKKIIETLAPDFIFNNPSELIQVVNNEQ